MPSEVVRAAETAAVTTTPVVYSVAGLQFMGITFSDWVLIGTAILLSFNIVFAVAKFREMFRRKPDEH